MRTGRMHGWEKIVRGIKAGPDFGIHGTQYEKMRNILWENKQNKESGDKLLGGAQGHRFTVDQESRNVGDETFYTRLVASVGIALCYSKCYGDLDKGNYVFNNSPSILLGIDGERNGFFSENDNRRRGLFMAPWIHNGCSQIETFPIGHDFISNNDLVGLSLDKKECEEINSRWKEYSRGKILLGVDMVAQYLVQRECIERMIRKIYHEVRKY